MRARQGVKAGVLVVIVTLLLVTVFAFARTNPLATNDGNDGQSESPESHAGHQHGPDDASANESSDPAGHQHDDNP